MAAMETVGDFNAFVAEIESDPNYKRPMAFGIGIGNTGVGGRLVDTLFPFPNYGTNLGTAAVFAHLTNWHGGTETYTVLDHELKFMLESFFAPFEGDKKTHGNIEAIKAVKLLAEARTDMCPVIVFIGQDDQGPQTVADAYLRLHLLSHRLIKPHGIRLDGIFGILPNVVWTSEGPIAVEELPGRRLKAMCEGRHLVVHSVDKFPRMVDYVVPSGVRVADASRVRLGAYLGSGTTVMHEGFVNFNAGCEGPNMVEGRIPAGVFVGPNTDLGGGCSIMGTLSGGGKVVVSIGERCLIGANAGTGISLGNNCTIEAGLYVTAGTKVVIAGPGFPQPICTVVKARELSGQNDLLFIRDSTSGIVEVRRKPNAAELNAALHTKQ